MSIFWQAVEEYDYRKRQGLAVTWATIADEFGVNENTLRRKASEIRESKKQEEYPNFIPITGDIPTDEWDWQDKVARLAHDKRYLRVAHACDVHFPYHDPAALELYYRLVRRYDPHIIVIGSDQHDFPTISKFAPTGKMSDDDVIDAVAPYHAEHIMRLDAAAPDCIMPWIQGNHDARWFAFIYSQAPQIRNVATRGYVDLIRAGGRVLWLGPEVDEVEIGSLTVAHGTGKTLTKHGARNQLDERYYQRHITTGHAHRPQEVSVRGPEYTVNSVISGCLCRLVPHYQRGKKRNDWQHGSAFWTLDMQTGNAWAENIRFLRDDHEQRLVAVLGGMVLSVPMPDLGLTRHEPTPLEQEAA